MRRSVVSLLVWALAVGGCAKAASKANPGLASDGTTGGAGTTRGSTSGSSTGTAGSSGSTGGSSGSTGSVAPGYDDPHRAGDLALYDALLAELPNLGPADREARIDRFLADVASAGGAPLRQGGDTLFLYRGSSPAAINGDFNNKWLDPPRPMTQVLGTSLWSLEVQLNAAERHQYRVVVNGTAFEDPLDPWVQWDGVDTGGLGSFNSVFVSPLHPPDVGELRHEHFHSMVEGNTRDVFVYLPPQYLNTPGARFASLYNQDGNEASTRGRLQVAAQATFDDGTARPTVLVFVALDDQHQRADEYTMVGDPTQPSVQPRGALYAQLLADELVPYVDARFRTVQNPLARGIAGQGLGGLSAYYVGYSRPDTFGNMASQSGAFDWASDALIATIQNGQAVPVTCYLDTGTPGDTSDVTNLMDQALTARGYTHHLVTEAGAQPAWADWQRRYANVTRYFFPPLP